MLKCLHDTMRYIIIKILNILSKRILAKYEPVVVGIAGSAEKGNVKKMICEVLNVETRQCLVSTEIGIPLAIIGAESGGRSVAKWLEIIFLAVKMIIKKIEYPEILILEMNIDKPGDMKKILEVVKPNIGVLTNTEKSSAQIKYFKNRKHFVKEKSLLVKSLKKKDLAILNCDDECTKDLFKNARSKIITYGFNDSSTLKAGKIFSGDEKMSFKISYEGTFVPFRLSYALDKSQVYAILAASAIGIHFGYNLVEISEKLSNHKS